MRGKKLSKTQTREVRRLFFKERMGRTAIAEQLGIPYHQVHYATYKKGYKVSSEKKTEEAIDYKAKYLKAVALLVEHGILEVEL